MQSTGEVQVQGLCLLEFDESLVIDKHKFIIFNADFKHTLIIRKKILSEYSINLNYNTLEVKRFSNIILLNITGFAQDC